MVIIGQDVTRYCNKIVYSVCFVGLIAYFDVDGLILLTGLFMCMGIMHDVIFCDLDYYSFQYCTCLITMDTDFFQFLSFDDFSNVG